jgi:hypothetical protein
VNLYFDTNVYRHLTACDELAPAKKLLRARRARLTASSSNLQETVNILSTETRAQELHTLTRAATHFEDSPQSWHHAMEFLAAIRRFRPHWLSLVVHNKRARAFLRAHRGKWDEARAGVVVRGPSHALYHRDSEQGIAHNVSAQKQERGNQQVAGEVTSITVKCGDGQPHEINRTGVDAYWRSNCLSAWSAAIVNRIPSSRDYFDWLDPYLKKDALKSEEHGDFWFQDVEASDVPRNCLTSLTSYYQLEAKITHGNGADQLHANHLLDVDHFFTADRAFHGVLLKAATHFPEVAKVHLIDRGAPTCVEQIQAALAA